MFPQSKVIRVLNLWQKNTVFAPEVIQPLFDMADPGHPKYKEVAQIVGTKSSQSASGSKFASNISEDVSNTINGAGDTSTGYEDASNDGNQVKKNWQIYLFISRSFDLKLNCVFEFPRH